MTLSERYKLALGFHEKLLLDSTNKDNIKNQNNHFRDVIINTSINSIGELDLSGSALLFLQEEYAQTTGFYSSVPLSKLFCKQINSRNEHIQCQFFNDFIDCCNKVIKNLPSQYQAQKTTLDNIISSLIKHAVTIGKLTTSLKNELLHRLSSSLAWAYFYRSKLYKARGIGVHFRKIEALVNARTWASRASDSATYIIPALVALDLRGTPDELNEKEFTKDLNEALNNTSSTSEFNILRFEISMGLIEHDPSQANEHHAILKSCFSDSDLSTLNKIRAEVALSNVVNKLILSHLVKELKKRFFTHQDWDTAYRLSFFAYNINHNQWQQIVLAVWEACDHQAQTGDPLRLRWYWSKQRGLYDLAVLAAEADPKHQENLQKQLEIIDALKSRPAKSPEAISLHEDGMAGFVTDMHDRAHGIESRKTCTDFNLPPGWDYAIHLHAGNHSNLEPKTFGTALIQRRDDSGFTLTVEHFNWHSIFTAYMNWQQAYFSSDERVADERRDTAPLLLELCKAIGKEMPFLFDIASPSAGNEPSSRAILVGHDFLHRIPFHAAIKDNRIWGATNLMTYMPAWDFKSYSGNVSSDIVQNVVFENFEQGEYEDIEELAEDNPFLKFERGASIDVVESQTPLSKMLIFLCHGKSHRVHPYGSKLLLNDKRDFDCRYILASEDFKESIKGKDVVIGACETDLVPPIQHPIDEHQSISTSFLQCGARSVLGTMWQAESNAINTAIFNILRSNQEGLPLKLWNKQKQIFGRPTDSESFNISEFFDWACFRTLGIG